jgi:hypothetical protein
LETKKLLPVLGFEPRVGTEQEIVHLTLKWYTVICPEEETKIRVIPDSQSAY